MTYTKGRKVKLSKNFVSTEFDCQGRGCCTETYIDDELVERLQQIRDHFGAAVTINSGYRCSKHNRNVGGATRSKHVQGMAADIVVRNIAPIEVARYAESIGIKGIGLYDSFVHVDTRASKSFWYGYAEEYRSTFGGAVSNAVVVDKSLNIGDKVRLAADAKYFNGKDIPSWVKHMTLYVRGFRDDGYVTISYLKVGAITGAVDKKFLTKM